MRQDKRPYTMKISRTTIDKLGVKLYDRVSAVVAEIVANSYDADAEEVEIIAPMGVYLASKKGETITDLGYEIIVKDNGHGMTPDEVNEHYLIVGINRRTSSTQGPTSRKFIRPVMGRKGIGKLAPFGICKQIEIISAGGKKTKKGFLTAHILLNYDEILSPDEEDYHPTPGEKDQTYRPHSGTEVILRNFNYRLVPNMDTFHRQLAARFGIARPDWKISLRYSTEDQAVQVGELEIALLDGTRVVVNDKPVILEDGSELPISGWVGYSKVSYRDEVMAGIRIYARGKIVAQTRDFDIKSGFPGEYKLRSYVVGEIHADWLDEDEGEDLIRSDRQDILWNTDIGIAFRNWGQILLRELSAKSETSLGQQVWEVFLEKSKISELAKERFEDKEMQDDVLRVARRLVSRKDREALEDQDWVTGMTNLAFSVAPHRILVERLREVGKGEGSFDTLVKFFVQARVAENYSLGQIAHERVSAIERLRYLWKEASDESELQNLVEEAPWLINPEWTPLTANQTLNRFRQAFEDWYFKKHGQEIVTSAIDFRNKRPDFVLLNVGDALEIVEIKKADHHLEDEEFGRIDNYKRALEQFLEDNPEFMRELPGRVHTTIICDGLKLTGVSETAFEALVGNGSLTQRSWLEFLNRTQRAHEDFLKVFHRVKPADGV